MSLLLDPNSLCYPYKLGRIKSNDNGLVLVYDLVVIIMELAKWTII